MLALAAHLAYRSYRQDSLGKVEPANFRYCISFIQKGGLTTLWASVEG